MAETVVEITGDARKLEQAFDAIEKRQAAQDAGYQSMAKAGQDSASQIAAAHEDAAKRSNAAFDAVEQKQSEQVAGFTQITEAAKASADQVAATHSQASIALADGYADASKRAGAAFDTVEQKQSEQAAGFTQITDAATTSAEQVATAQVDAANRFATAYVDAAGNVRDEFGRIISDSELATAKGTADYERLTKAGVTSSDQVAKAQDTAATKTVTSYNKILQELRRQGPEGRDQAKAIEKYLAEASLGGRRSIEAIIEELGKFDDKAAEVATNASETFKAKLAAADEATKFNKTLDELRKINKPAADAAEAVRKGFEDADAAVKFDQIIKQLEDIDPKAADEAKKLKEQMNGAAEEGTGAFQRFRASAIGQITEIAGSYASIHTAIATIIDLNGRVRQSNKDAFQSLQNNASGDARLLQVATDKEDFDKLRSRADELATTYGIDREQARQLVFSARSENFEGSLDVIAANAQTIDVSAQAGVAGQLPALFRGQVTGEQAIDATLAAAAESRLNFEQIGTAMPAASEGASAAGATLAETASALSVLASDFKSGDVAGDRIKAFGAAVSLDKGNEGLGRKSLEGQGLEQAVRSLMAMSDEQRSDFLGTGVEVNAAYNSMSRNIELMESRRRKIDEEIKKSGTEESLTAEKRQIASSTPELVVQRDAAISKNRLEVEREQNRALAEGKRQTRESNQLAAAEDRGASPITIAAAEKAKAGLDSIGAAATSEIVVPMMTSDKLFNLERDLSVAAQAGDANAEAAILATHMLQRRREEDPNAVLSQQDVATFLSASTSQYVSPQAITDETQRELTEKIDSLAAQSRGTISAAISSRGTLAEEGSALAIALDDLVRTNQKMLDALDENNRLMAQQNNTLAATEENTRPGESSPPDYPGMIDSSQVDE